MAHTSLRSKSIVNEGHLMRKEARPSKGDTGEIIGDSGQEGNRRKRGGAGRIVFREKIRDLAPDLPYGVLKEKTLDDNLVDPRAGGGTGD